MSDFGSQAFLQGNEQLLRSMDETFKDLEQTIARYHGPSSTPMNNYWNHFSYIWRELYRQQGWPPVHAPSWKRRLRLKLESLCTGVQACTEAPLSSPIFTEPKISLTLPPEVSTYTTAYGFKICSAGPDMWSLMATGHYSSELSETILMLRLTPHLTHFVDVGANIGFFSLLVANESSGRIKVVAFEPFAQSLIALRGAVAANGFDRSITVIPKAVGNVNGVADLKLCTLGSGGHSLSNYATDDNHEGHQQVEVLRLDDVYHDLIPQGAKTFLKIDVESAEYDVLCGCPNWLLDKTAPIILFEAWPIYLKNMKEQNHILILNMLKKYNYRLFKIEELKNGQAPIAEITNFKSFRVPVQGNYLAIPAWADDLVDRLRSPVDVRVFSKRSSIEAMRSFLTDSLLNVKKFIEAEGTHY
jgi:FkbM family methyltransferase